MIKNDSTTMIDSDPPPITTQTSILTIEITVLCMFGNPVTIIVNHTESAILIATVLNPFKFFVRSISEDVLCLVCVDDKMANFERSMEFDASMDDIVADLSLHPLLSELYRIYVHSHESNDDQPCFAGRLKELLYSLFRSLALWYASTQTR